MIRENITDNQAMKPNSRGVKLIEERVSSIL